MVRFITHILREYMMTISIYHNPRCSKSRQTLALLKENGHDPEIIEYLNHPPTVETLDGLCSAMGKEPLEIMRTKETLFKELGLTKKDDRPRREWLELMVANPKLIERPIVVNGERAAMGRPPEDVLGIL